VPLLVGWEGGPCTADFLSFRKDIEIQCFRVSCVRILIVSGRLQEMDRESPYPSLCPPRLECLSLSPHMWLSQVLPFPKETCRAVSQCVSKVGGSFLSKSIKCNMHALRENHPSQFTLLLRSSDALMCLHSAQGGICSDNAPISVMKKDAPLKLQCSPDFNCGT
jgi:hypothetical protein